MIGSEWGDCVEQGVATLKCIPVAIKNIITAAIVFAGVAAVIFIIWAGLKFITSGGDQKKVTLAKQTLTFAIVGLIVILLSFFILNLIAYFAGLECIKVFGFDACKT